MGSNQVPVRLPCIRGSPEMQGVSERDGGTLDDEDVSDGCLRALGGTHLSRGITSVE